MQEQHFTALPSQKSLLVKTFFIFLMGLLMASFFSQSQAQVSPNLGGVSKMMERAKAAMKANDFSRANYYFREIIDGGHTIPADLPYYFAETLFELHQYDNSAGFLKKFMEINGKNHELHEKGKALEMKLEEPLSEISNCQLCDHKGYQFKTCSTCEGEKVSEQECSYCKGKGIIGCSHCVGTGLITKKNIFNIKEFYECERCNGNGRLTCPKCEGSLVEISSCKTCDGSGVLHSDIICDHKPAIRSASQQ